MAKARQVSSPTLVRRFSSSHSSAQARILSRLARGSDGGGFDVSAGASGGSLDAASGPGAGVVGGGFVTGAGAAAFGFVAVAGLAPGLAEDAGFAGAGFAALGLAGDAP